MNNLLPYIKALEPITSRTRCDVTAIKKDGKISFTKQGLTDNRLIAHLENKLPRGVYPIKPSEDTCRVALLDLDSHKGETPLEVMFSAAKTLRDHMLTKGLHVNAFLSSGGKGIHLYTLWDAPQDAYSVRQLLIEVLADCGYKNGTGGVAQGEIEIFPKQDKVRADGVGSMFILPLTGHSAPIDLNSMTKLDREAILSSDFWQFSYDVPKKERKSPMRPLSTISDKQSEEVNKSARYISVLDPDMGYDEWLKVGMALHQVSQGRDDGFFVWDDWSSQGEKYTGSDMLRSKWDSFKLDHDNGITIKTLEWMARTANNSVCTMDEFDGNEQFKPRPKVTHAKSGEIEATSVNVKKYVERPDLIGLEIKFDMFRDEIMFRTEGAWTPFTDNDYTRLRYKLKECHFKEVGRELIRDVVAEIADSNRFDSAIEWIENLPAWDGVQRIERFFPTYMGAEDTPYTQAVGSYIWTAMAGRVLEPGCKADMVPILVGKQGIRKSTAVAELVSNPELFCEISFSEKEDDISRKMRGCLIAEIGELRGLHSKELEAIKAFIARRVEKWIPKYKEFGTKFPRRLVFIGTTNQTEFLADDTGNRRWLPVDVVMADVDAIISDREQLWAEARVKFKDLGVAYKGLEELASQIHPKYMMDDPWENIISEWLRTPEADGKSPEDKEYITMEDVLVSALNVDYKNMKGPDSRRVGKILRKLGYKKADRRIKGNSKKVWIKDE